ncbi:hypothetical protein BJ912DRAFT_703599 [Pholiota molesta]|nr:hypothetical protein BJ912DRAFT_703599 [Pholiota molesta]
MLSTPRPTEVPARERTLFRYPTPRFIWQMGPDRSLLRNARTRRTVGTGRTAPTPKLLGLRTHTRSFGVLCASGYSVLRVRPAFRVCVQVGRLTYLCACVPSSDGCRGLGYARPGERIVVSYRVVYRIVSWYRTILIISPGVIIFISSYPDC